MIRNNIAFIIERVNSLNSNILLQLSIMILMPDKNQELQFVQKELLGSFFPGNQFHDRKSKK